MISKRCYLKIDSNKPLKDELDRAIVQSYENQYYLMKVLKSKIKGREYYAAVRVKLSVSLRKSKRLIAITEYRF